MKITFLEASVPLTKTFTIVDGQLTKTGHPRIIDCTSHTEEFDSIEELYEHVKKHADLGHSMLKGNVNRKLYMESRAGSTDPHAPTRLLLLDLDGVKDVDNVERFLKFLGFGDVDYIVQYSSSMGVIPSRGISAHILILLSCEASPAILKQWLMGQNFSIPILRNNIGLTRTNNSLRWTLDVSTCQNDKLIYIAPPVLGEGVHDTFQGDRIQLIKKSKRVVDLPNPIPSPESNKVESEKVLNSLRAAGGLPARNRVAFKTQGVVEYQSKPDQASVTGIKTERGFTYLNLNGGDSWGYYHPESNPEFIFNFKSEPNYKTSELLPEYWQEAREKLNELHPDNTGTYYLAIRDFKTAAYWNGNWTPGTQTLRLAEARGKSQLIDFMKQHGQPIGDFIPDWDIAFQPNDDYVVDLETKRINTFQPSIYMTQRCDDIPHQGVPPGIRRLITHAVGDDEECFEHMMNWLAVIFQHRCRTETCWVLQGVEGTGKGLFLNRVLRPLFKYVVFKRMSEMDSQFNGFLEKCLILWIDEMQLSALKSRADSVESDLKSTIVEPKLSIRRMHTMPYEADNYCNIIIPGNKDDVMNISPTDRRFNVCPYQGSKFITSDEELDQIEQELPAFAAFLHAYKCSRQRARTALNNDAKGRMVHITAPGLDEVCREINKGNLQFFWDQRPAMSLTESSIAKDVQAGAYLGIMLKIAKGERPVMLREELQVLMGYTLGNVPASPYKFASLLKHHKVFLESVRRDGKSARGIKVNWIISDDLRREIVGPTEGIQAVKGGSND